ncbi:MAG: sulfotransferase domain-containing protein [Egibacteraceae bacterium]
MTRSTDLIHRVGEFLPARLRPVARRPLIRFRQFGLTPVDAVLVSYPKSGSTWLRFLLGSVLGGQEVDFDSVRDALPPIGRHRGAPRLLPSGGRVVRSHEPLDALTGRGGQPVVYLVRDGRDVAVSYLHHLRRIGGFTGDFAAFLPRFLSGTIDGYGPWHTHVQGALAPRDRQLTVRYEDLRRATVSELARILAFLGVEPEVNLLEAAVAANAKDRMRAKEQTSKLLARQNADGSSFVRGDGGPSWRQLLDPAALTEFERVAGPALQAFGYPMYAVGPP